MIPGIGDHHSAIMVDSLIMVNKLRSRKVYQYHKGDWDSIKAGLSSSAPKFLSDCQNMNVDGMWNSFHSKMMSLRERYIPSKTVKSQQSLPWINHVLRRLMRKQLRLFHRRTKSKKDLKKYTDLKKAVQRMTRQVRWNYINDIVNQGEDKARKGFWSYVKSFTSDNKGIAVLQKGGIKATSPREKAELLNKQFSSVFTEEATDVLPQMSNKQYPGIGSLVITVKGVEKMLLNLNANKAAGQDDLHGKLLKNTAKESALLLHAIFQCSIESGAIPEAWKKAIISSVYKKSDSSDHALYRPVSLTCISCKIQEHIINRHILDHLDKHNILADVQHGFGKRRSCETQLLLTCHDLASVMNDSGQVDMLVLDFAKAFDTVAHRRLLSKVAGYGCGNMQRWITSLHVECPKGLYWELECI